MSSSPKIYIPTGAAFEYSKRALNLYTGCTHACEYCYAAHDRFRPNPDFRTVCKPRTEDMIDCVRKEARKLANTTDRVLLCFTSDPYQPAERDFRLTRQALEIFNAHNIPWQVCTKNGAQALEDDLDLFLGAGCCDGSFNPRQFKPGLDVSAGWLGQTIVFTNEDDRALWEPGAPELASRFYAAGQAKTLGITNWVSIEPVIDPEQALAIVTQTWGFVDILKIGRINHLQHLKPELRAKVANIDWATFTHRLASTLASMPNARYIIKDSLAQWWPEDMPRDTSGIEVSPCESRAPRPEQTNPIASSPTTPTLF